MVVYSKYSNWFTGPQAARGFNNQCARKRLRKYVEHKQKKQTEQRKQELERIKNNRVEIKKALECCDVCGTEMTPAQVSGSNRRKPYVLDGSHIKGRNFIQKEMGLTVFQSCITCHKDIVKILSNQQDVLDLKKDLTSARKLLKQIT